MNQQCFVVDFAHSINGRVKRIQVSYRSLAYVAGFLLIFCLSAGALFSSYVRMSWKVSNYDHLHADFDRLRTRYVELQRQSNQHKQQMASLETLASEVSVAYGINQPKIAEDAAALDSDSMTARESIEHFNFLESTAFSGIYHHYAYRWQSHNEPSVWPVSGIIRSAFGGRMDPFSGEGTFHTGLDLQATTGTPVHVTADGVIESAGWGRGYGKLVVVDHGNGMQTYYAHLSHFLVVPGQEVRRGEVIALSGGTGHATGPHLHYEVRLAGTPVNPYRYLAKLPNPQGLTVTHSDLGL